MVRFRIAGDFVAELATVRTVEGLRRALIAVKVAMGFDYVALSHHADVLDTESRVIRVHDYPERWVKHFDRHRLGRCDPVHRASHVTSKGFPWSRIGQMIEMQARDWAVLREAEAHDIGEGYTIPVHVPGEFSGSVSFAMRVGRPLPEDMLVILPQIATHAFDCARDLWQIRPLPDTPPALTPKQRLFLKWALRGKTDVETSKIVGCKPCTVVRQLKLARERYDVDNKTLLLILALLDGTLSLADYYVP